MKRVGVHLKHRGLACTIPVQQSESVDDETATIVDLLMHDTTAEVSRSALTHHHVIQYFVSVFQEHPH